MVVARAGLVVVTARSEVVTPHEDKATVSMATPYTPPRLLTDTSQPGGRDHKGSRYDREDEGCLSCP